MSIKTIAIVHHTHVDLGYTDHQQTCLRLHRHFIDEALDTIERTREYPEGARFRWTQEVFWPLLLWWKGANAKARARLLYAVRTGEFEVCGLPVNVTNFPDEREWAHMLSFLPRAVYSAHRPQAIMQNDVNGISRRGLEMAYDRGVRILWMGPNSYYGMPPQPAPFAFEWEVAEGKRVGVWCNSSYNDGTFLFNENWRQGPVPAAHDLRYRAPQSGDIFRCDAGGLCLAHALLQKRLALLTDGGCESADTDGFTKSHARSDYPYQTLITSVTGQWRCDNDPPFAPLSDFVRAWNAQGYTPRLEIVTFSQAMELLMREKPDIPVYKGVWSDYWANGLATCPAEMRAAREARRFLTAAHEPSLGAFLPAHRRDEKKILDDLMLFGEHSFASWDSAAQPYGENTRGQIAEKQVFSYRALEGARMLLADRVRAAVCPPFGTVTVINPTDAPRIVRLDLPLNALRGNYTSLFDSRTGRAVGLYPRPGRGNFLRPQSQSEFSDDNVARTFGDRCPDMRMVSDAISLSPHEKLTMPLCEKEADIVQSSPAPQIRFNTDGWPEYVCFADAQAPLVNGMMGEFSAIRADGVSPRWTFKDVFNAEPLAERRRLSELFFTRACAVYEPCERIEERGLICFSQRFSHPSLLMGRRVLTVDCLTKRASVTVTLDRKSDFTPEIFYLGFRSGVDAQPFASLAGQEFTPGKDNLPGTNRDFFCLDGCLCYDNGARWAWFARDSSLVCIGAPRPCLRANIPPSCTDFFAQVFDNTWDTNFNANSFGRMEFRFDVYAGTDASSATDFEALSTEEIVLVTTRNQ